MPIPINQSKKRKALPEAISSRGKKQRTEVSESELSNLVKQMPALLSGQTFFGVEQAVGLDLKKLPKTTQDELGIGSIRKVQNQTQYTVQISDLSKYRDAYNKYTAPLFVTAANTNNPLYSQNQSTDAQSFSPQEEQRNNSENQPLINAAAKTSHVTTAVLLEAEENTLDFIPNRLIHPEQSSQNNSYHFQQSEETLDDDLFLFDSNLEDDTSFNMLEPINPQTESTSPTTILRSDTTTYRSQTTSSPTLFGHQFNTQTTNTFVACHTNTSTEEIIDLLRKRTNY